MRAPLTFEAFVCIMIIGYVVITVMTMFISWCITARFGSLYKVTLRTHDVSSNITYYIRGWSSNGAASKAFNKYENEYDTTIATLTGFDICIVE